jgi:hypothetical protein
MVNSGLINGVPVHSSKFLLTDLLKGELGFDGFIVTGATLRIYRSAIALPKAPKRP